MRKVDLVWSREHYRAHMLPIFRALPEEIRGEIRPRTFDPVPGNVGMVASWDDVEQIRENFSYFYVEHGAGQSYGGDEKTALQPGYSGSGGYRHWNCMGFICPSETVGARWTTAPSIAVGCPKMDYWLSDRPSADPNTVCFAWHWNSRISPEALSAFHHYSEALPEIVASFKRQGWRTFGHAHPKWEGEIDFEMHEAGLTLLSSADAVLGSMSMLIMDNSSLMYEMAALGRPVIALNAPWYRRDIEHGLRFWDLVPGDQIDEPQQLLDLDLKEFWLDANADVARSWRKSVTATVYKYTDGQSSQRAADFIAIVLQQ